MADRVSVQSLNHTETPLIDRVWRVEESVEEVVEVALEGRERFMQAVHNQLWTNLEGKLSWIFQSMSAKGYVSSLLVDERVRVLMCLYLCSKVLFFI